MRNSNFAVVMDLLGITTQTLSEAVGADATRISRWRTGSRKLISGRQWAEKIAAFFIDWDAAQETPLLKRLLTPFYPVEDVDDPQTLHALTERFLTRKGQFDDAYQLNRKRVLTETFSQAPARGTKRRDRKDKGLREVVLGEKKINSALLLFLERAIELGEPMRVLFVCPEDLALITENEAFGTQLMDRLMQLFTQGSRLTVVLRTDFKMSDVAYFSGPWLVAHLLGYVQSFYYDDFRKTDDIKMMIIFSNKMAARILPDSKHKYRGEFFYNTPDIDRFEHDFMTYYNASTHRFHYSFFQTPEDFLLDFPAKMNGDCYQFAKLPHFGVHGDIPAELKLTEEETGLLRSQFAPFLLTPGALSPTSRVYHVFCAEEIESALEKPRHLAAELSEMLNRRVYMPTQALVDHLALIRALLKSRDNYFVCFLPEQAFDRFVMQIAVWGSEAAVGWIPRVRSTACKDYTNVGALHGFCATIWTRIPSIAKSKNTAVSRLDAWLRKAGRIGYTVKSS